MIVKNIPQVLVRAYELPMRGVMKRFFFLFVCFFVFFWEGGGGGGGGREGRLAQKTVAQ